MTVDAVDSIKVVRLIRMDEVFRDGFVSRRYKIGVVELKEQIIQQPATRTPGWAKNK